MRPRPLGGWAFGRALLVLGASGCADPARVFDSLPITAERGPGGELVVQVMGDDGVTMEKAVVDTGTPVTLWRHTTTGAGRPQASARTLSIYGAGATPPLRARFERVTTLPSVLGNVGTVETPLSPGALLGGDFLAAHSIEIGFAAPTITFWSKQVTPDWFLSTWGYAVLRIRRHGGGEIDATAPEEKIGPTGPYRFGPSLLVMRTCASPEPFVREAPLPACCPGEERTLATGLDLSLVLATGVGPTVLSRSAWTRLTRKFPTLPALVDRPLLVATSAQPIAAGWSKIPRLAFVDREADLVNDPGPCVELGRARRLEQVAVLQAATPEVAACALPCDRERGNGLQAQNSAAYVELAGDFDVAVIEDHEPLLQTLRAQIRPEGPEIDGLAGATLFSAARIEIDYQPQPARAIFACEAQATALQCRAVGRCPRLPGFGQTRSCFGLPPHGLPRMCENAALTCQ